MGELESSISWLDFSEDDRRKMMEVVSLFKLRAPNGISEEVALLKPGRTLVCSWFGQRTQWNVDSEGIALLQWPPSRTVGVSNACHTNRHVARTYARAEGRTGKGDSGRDGQDRQHDA